ncbi:hypothetical protein DQ04_07401020 [Trypanosoma grayi]|uniref:hypothetical protein n=1 Tax=Trypanosoma grayi TaxID=71804 RepID=UPI0004F40C05|nr:hypothetical protein DQ04_07401020 [Trypanosoma grayi]KEG08347.1 hypothetical protein DQ04_07401020 [Trypanosoma grayi]
MPVGGFSSQRKGAVGQGTDVYCELLFAGFPPRGHQASFTATFIQGFFTHYGEVRHFIYDADRGIGSVTFVDGEVAVGCYLAMHLSLLSPPGSEGDNKNNNNNGSSTAELFLIYLEFAQFCPFVNPSLLLVGELSRRSLRHSAKLVAQRIASSRKKNRNSPVAASAVAAHVVVMWNDADEKKRGGAESKVRLVRDGPHFPLADANAITALDRALWSALKPDGPPSAAGDTVTVLDLWWEYYQRYVVHKTEPEASRIKDPYFNYAQKATVAQEIYQALKLSREDADGDVQHAKAVVGRLTSDDVYHSVCGYLCFKLCLRNDPSWASLARDVAATGGAATGIAAGTSSEDGSNRDDVGDDDKRVEAAEAALLKLPLLQAASNLIDNVRFLRRVRSGEVTANNSPAKANEENDTSWRNYPTSSRREEEDFYMEVLHTLDGFAPSAKAVSLLSMCEDPHTFRDVKGHIGWDELHKKKKSNWWVMCQAITVALLLMAFASWISMQVARWMGITHFDGPRSVGRSGAGVPFRRPEINIRLEELREF